MRPNNNFHGPGNLQHIQGSFQQNYADDGYIALSPAASNQQYFQMQSPQAMQCDEDDFMAGNYQSEAGLYNEVAVSQNQHISPDGLVSEQAPQLSTTTTQVSSRPALDAQAQKLKALVKKSQEQRAKSGTPPGPGTRPLRTTEGASSLRDSPIIPGGSSDEPSGNTVKNPSTNDAVEALLSEMKAGTDPNTKDTKTQINSSLSKPQSKTTEKDKISPTSLSTISPKNTPQDGASRSSSEARKIVNRKQSNGESSDASEGEIRESVPRPSKQLAGQKEGHTLARPINRDEQVLNKKRDEQIGKISRISETRGQSPSPNSRGSILRNRNERHEMTEERSEKKNYHSTNKYERSYELGPEQKFHQRDLRDRAEEGRKQEFKYERKDEAFSRKPETITLAQMLEIDEDLRDWLNYTGYHKAEYRNKVLNRRRAIAALDAQKAKLLEEMEIEERRGLQTPDTSQTAASMLPPPIPTKINTGTVTAKKTDDTIDRGSSNQAQAPSTKDIGVKRTYTDYQEPRNEGTSEKMGRLDEQGRGVRIKGENHDDHRPYHSNAHERYNRRSPSTEGKNYRHEDRDTSTEGRGRGRERNYSQESDSPFSMRTYENRTLARSKSYDFPELEERDDRFGGRQFVHVGNYKGRSFDPNFRYRGRGRGNWTSHHDIKPRPQSGYPNAHITGIKPYKDPRPLDRGGRGATRYFVVKSFNEENVLRSMDDGIWTTQVQNGDLFKHAFLTCKNVILIYSINQSRAFQGYARMESVPGSEEPPRWMNNIIWQSTGPFRVRWLTIAPTPFNRVSYLKNSLNDDQPVLIAKDGQEVEESCAIELTKLIDEEADRSLRNCSPHINLELEKREGVLIFRFF